MLLKLMKLCELMGHSYADKVQALLAADVDIETVVR